MSGTYLPKWKAATERIESSCRRFLLIYMKPSSIFESNFPYSALISIQNIRIKLVITSEYLFYAILLTFLLRGDTMFKNKDPLKSGEIICNVSTIFITWYIRKS